MRFLNERGHAHVCEGHVDGSRVVGVAQSTRLQTSYLLAGRQATSQLAASKGPGYTLASY